MTASKTKEARWQLIAKDWLMAELKASAAESPIKVWDVQLLADLAEMALDIKKSKRSWERFLADLPLLQVTTALDELRDNNGNPARALVISQLIDEAQRSRRPIYFLAIHHLDDLSVAVISTTKGKKTWVALHKNIGITGDYGAILDRIAKKVPSSFLVARQSAGYGKRSLRWPQNQVQISQKTRERPGSKRSQDFTSSLEMQANLLPVPVGMQ